MSWLVVCQRGAESRAGQVSERVTSSVVVFGQMHTSLSIYIKTLPSEQLSCQFLKSDEERSHTEEVSPRVTCGWNEGVMTRVMWNRGLNRRNGWVLLLQLAVPFRAHKLTVDNQGIEKV